MEQNSYKTALMIKNSGTYEKLVDIKDYPDLGGAPELLEVTTLSDKAKRYIPGIDNNDALEFTSNYTKEDYTKLLALKGQELDLAIWFGGTESAGIFEPTGNDGKFIFKGYISASLVGASVNTIRDMKIHIAPSSSIEFAGE